MLKSGVIVQYKMDKTIFGITDFRNKKIKIRYLINLDWLAHDIADYETIAECEEFWKVIQDVEKWGYC